MSITINCRDATHFDSEDDYLTETLVTVKNSSFQDYAHPDHHAPNLSQFYQFLCFNRY